MTTLRTKPEPTDNLDLHAWIQPVPPSAVFRDPVFNIWCGSMTRTLDGKCHLFYSRWPRRLGHNAWVTHSEIARAVSDNPLGPYRHVEVVLPARGPNYWDGSCTHNPTILRIGKRYCLYYMGNWGDGIVGTSLNWTHRNHQRIGVAIADRPEGPWKRFDHPIIDVSPNDDAPDALMTSNPTACVRPDGSILLIYKAVAKKNPLPFGGPVVHLVATAEKPEGPFRKNLSPIFTRPGEKFAAEDPFIWHDGTRYRAVVKDFNGIFTGKGYSIALWESDDGFVWRLSKHPLVTTPEIRWKDGTVQKMNALERPQLWFENGRPAILFCAGAETASRDGSFNIAIPLVSPSPSPDKTDKSLFLEAL
jgi:hypothetical protein